MSANAVRDEKVKVLKSIRWMTPESIPDNTVRAQYTAGHIGGQNVPGYTQESDVDNASIVPTFAAVRLFVDNWRWNGVPFYLRSGKALWKRGTDVVIQFKKAPPVLFRREGLGKVLSNRLIFHVQPDQAIESIFQAKIPGPTVQL